MAPLSACQARKSAEDLQPSQRSCHHLTRRAKRRTRSWNVGTWNVRSTCMVDTEGSVAIASTMKNGQRGEDRKVDLVVGELRRYNVKVAGLQETKWFDSSHNTRKFKRLGMVDEWRHWLTKYTNNESTFHNIATFTQTSLHK